VIWPSLPPHCQAGETRTPPAVAFSFGVDPAGGAFLEELTWKGKAVVKDDSSQRNRYFLHGDLGTKSQRPARVPATLCAVTIACNIHRGAVPIVLCRPLRVLPRCMFLTVAVFTHTFLRVCYCRRHAIHV
jgi:hypothetical protein